MKHLLTIPFAALMAAMLASCSSLAFWRSAEQPTAAAEPAAAAVVAAPAASFSLHRNYGDHMVLQQGRPIPICGQAEPGTELQVTLGPNTVTTEADGDGEWRAVLPPMRGGMEPYTLTVAIKEPEAAAATAPIVLNDVLIGEVWFCSGQSNMELPLQTGTKGWSCADGDKVAAQGMTIPTIRLFNAAIQKYPSSYSLQADPKGEWTLPTAEELKRFSAVAYFFGCALTRELEVPVGLIESCWSGTRIQPWISARAIKEGGPDFDNLYTLLQQVDPRHPAPSFRTLQAEWYTQMLGELDERVQEGKTQTPNTKRWAQTTYKTNSANGWEVQQKTAGELIMGRSKNQRGIFWFATYVDIPKAWEGKELRLEFSFLDDCDTTFFNGVQVGKTDFAESQWPSSARRNYTVPANLVKAGRAKVAMRVVNLWGNGGVCRDRFICCGTEKVRLNGEWFTRTETTELPVDDVPAFPGENVVPNTRQFPAALFNSMVYPWTRYPVRGVIWYQGESNAGECAAYAKLFKLMAQDWRSHWSQDYLDETTRKGIPGMPFIYCQLSGYPAGDNWPAFRQMQQELLKEDPLFGMAVTMDHGDETIHPPEKKPVGERLAAQAMQLSYASKKLASGPVPASCTAQDGIVKIHFEDAGVGLVAADGKPLVGFEVAGKDGKFVPADAVIIERNILLLSAKEVAEPLRARYAWCAICPGMNLANREGFPAAPFDVAVQERQE